MPFFGGNIWWNVKPGGWEIVAKIHGVGNWNPPSQYGKASWQMSRFSRTESADHLKLFHECHAVVNLPAAEGDTPNLYIGLFISACQW